MRGKGEEEEEEGGDEERNFTDKTCNRYRKFLASPRGGGGDEERIDLRSKEETDRVRSVFSKKKMY